LTVRIVQKFPTCIRWTHWINFPLLFLMIWSGTLIYWANDVYWFFYPSWFYKMFNIGHRLAEGMAIHFFIMWLFMINGVVFLAYLFWSGEWRVLFPDKQCFRDAPLVALHDLGLRKELPPQGKLNAAQRITYTAVLLMAMGSVLSGFAIYKPTQLWWLVGMMGGYQIARVLHFVLTIGYVAFFFVHVGQVIKTGWNCFRAMITGFEVENP
jgi:thiosulfate reductase cytochrome b subunit